MDFTLESVHKYMLLCVFTGRTGHLSAAQTGNTSQASASPWKRGSAVTVPKGTGSRGETSRLLVSFFFFFCHERASFYLIL